MQISLESLKKLRQESGAGIADCRQALEDAGGDHEKAKQLLAARGLEKAAKKEGKTTSQGIIDAYVHVSGKVGVLVELRCETDFVAKTDDFKKLAHEIALQVAAMDPNSVEELLVQPYIRDASVTIGSLIKVTIAKLGENVTVGQFTRLTLGN